MQRKNILKESKLNCIFRRVYKMKKIIIIVLICSIVCVTIKLAGCANEFAKQEYNDAEKIAQIEDRYAKDNSVINAIDGGYSLTVSKFNGRQTLWNKTLEKSTEIEIQIDLSISSGIAKVVYIDCDNNITVLIECSQNDADEHITTKTVSLTRGLNRFKIVGYDCKDIDLKILFDEPYIDSNN